MQKSLLLVALASSALLSACAGTAPVSPAPMSAPEVDDAADVTRATLATSAAATIAMDADTRPSLIVGSTEIQDVVLKKGVQILRSTEMGGAKGAVSAGKASLDTVELTVPGYSPAVTRWFLGGSKPGPTSVALVYRTRSGRDGVPTEVSSVTFGQAVVQSFEVVYDGDGLSTHLIFAASALKVVGTSPSATGKLGTPVESAYDFAQQVPKFTAPERDKRATVGAGVGNVQAAVLVDGNEVGATKPGVVLSYSRPVSFQGATGLMVGKVVSNELDLSVAGYSPLLSDWAFQANSKAKLALSFTSGQGGKSNSTEVLRIEHNNVVPGNYAMGVPSTFVYRGQSLTIIESPLDPTGKPTAKTTTNYDATTDRVS